MARLGFLVLVLLGFLALGGFVGMIVMIAVRAGSLKKRCKGSNSYFDGGAFAYIGLALLASLINSISLGFAYPWAICLLERWEKRHTVINGRRLYFDGRGIELFGWNILWNFLTVITFGIFTIWKTFYIHRWTVKHTVYDDGFGIGESRFTGGGWSWFVHLLFVFLMTVVSLGFAAPWAIKTYIKWRTVNTEIGGNQLVFKGTGGQLFGKCLLWGLLTSCTCGIFALFIPSLLKDWLVSSTDALYMTDSIQATVRSHEIMAKNDLANMKIAAAQSALELEKCGITPETSDSEIEEMANSGNAIAKYRLALIKKGDSEKFEGEALELLKSASNEGYHIAMYEYSAYAESSQEILSLLNGSARCGNMQAARALRDYFVQLGFDESYDYSERAKNLSVALYWFRLLIELGDGEALAMSEAYKPMTEMLALLICKDPANRHCKRMSTATTVWSAILGTAFAGVLVVYIVAAGLIGLIYLFFNKLWSTEMPDDVYFEPYVYTIYGENAYTEVADIYRDHMQIDTKTEIEPNFEFDEALDGNKVHIEGYLSDFAYVDYDKGVTYIDFGVGETSFYNGGEFSLYLVAPDYDDGKHTVVPLCSAIRNGESVYKINHVFPEGSIRLNVVMFNDYTGDRIEQGGSTIHFNDEQLNAGRWVATIYSKTVSVLPYSGEASSVDKCENAIIGQWESAARSGEYIYSVYYEFNSDGSFAVGGCEYMHTSYAPELFAGQPEGWQVVPMGYPYISGTYTVEGNVITIQATEYSEDGTHVSITDTLEVKAFDSESITLVDSSGVGNKFIKTDSETTIEDICNALGISLAP